MINTPIPVKVTDTPTGASTNHKNVDLRKNLDIIMTGN